MSVSTFSRSPNAMANAPEFLLTETEAANRLGLKPGTLRTWRSTGKPGQPEFVRIGRAVRYRASDLDGFMSSLTSGVPR